MKYPFHQKISKKAGMSPGQVIYVGDHQDAPPELTVIDFKNNQYKKFTTQEAKDCVPYKETPQNTWINLTGLHNVELLDQLGQQFEIHPLMLEDICNTYQRPKLEEYNREIFIVLKIPHIDQDTNELTTGQVAFILRQHYLLTFQQRPTPVFQNIEHRIQSGGKRITQMGNDYLLYTLIDAIVDHYFIILETFSNQVEDMEAQLLADDEDFSVYELYKLKREMIELRRAAWPLRDILSSIYRTENELITDQTQYYFRDVYDHSIQVIDTFESMRDVMSSLLDLHFTTVSNRMNEIMKVLTIIATIFIPLTFIAGIYGMNFAHMPELQWKWAYPAVWGVMLVIGGVMMIYFKRKNWL